MTDEHDGRHQQTPLQKDGTWVIPAHQMVSSDKSNERIRILVVDDEESLRHMLSLLLERAGYSVVLAKDGEDGLRVLEQHPGVRIALCDIRMPNLDGLGFLERARRLRPGLVIIMMSAYGTTETALKAMRRGAYDYVSKPFRSDEIVLTLKKVEERERLARENAILRAEVAKRRTPSGLVGAEGGLRLVMAVARKVATAPVTVLITGESGTGKEVLARAIHEMSPRAKGPFVAINCAAIPENLLESELFGHERGSFTGAIRTHQGLFEQASGGTLLLDEVGEMPPTLQIKLLRVIEAGQVRRLAGDRDIPVDVRLLAATARDLPQLVRRGHFREDLFYRLDVVHLHLPPLRERREDIPLLVDHFLTQQAHRLGRPRPPINPAAMRVLEAHSWPGNVRQLENACERAVLLCEGGITADDLPPDLQAGRVTGPDMDDLSIKHHVAALERELIRQALLRTDGNRSRAARLLDISYKALLYKIKDYGLSS